MKQSTSKILTTHTGSLPRSGSVAGMLEARDSNGEVDQQAFESRAEEAVPEVVNRQIAIDLDVINDGEQSKPSYATYVKDRFTGFDWTILIFQSGRLIMPVLRLTSCTGLPATDPSPGATGRRWVKTWPG